jgi:hypothetical protein
MTNPSHGSPLPGSPGPVPSPGAFTPGTLTTRLVRGTGVIIVSSVMFTFISYWRTAAVVLCDLASTAYYIGGIVEQAIGPAAPWFILAVMLFSYAVRALYIARYTSRAVLSSCAAASTRSSRWPWAAFWGSCPSAP